MTNTPLKIISWNANSIKNKINELTALINKLNIDIILLCETKLTPKLQLKIRNYHTYRTDNLLQSGNHASGGTAVLVHRRLVHRQITLNTSISSTTIEIASGNNTIHISAIYKAPNKQLKISDLNILTQSCDWFIVAGDFNAKHPYWNSRCVNAAGSVLYNHASHTDYSIIAPDTPTHFPNNPHHRPDVLDIALAKLPSQSIQISNLSELSSDHNPIHLHISDSPITVSPLPRTFIINWKKFENKIAQYFTTANPQVTNTQEIDAAIAHLTNSIKETIRNSSTQNSRKSTQNKLPLEITNEIKTKNILLRNWQLTRDPSVKRQLNSKIKFIRNILSTHRQDEWDKFLDCLDPNSIFKLNKSLLKTYPANHPLSGPTGLIYNAIDKAELLADTFNEQFSDNDGPHLPEVSESIRTINSTPALNKAFTTPAEIQQIIKRLPKRKAPGEDLITNAALKHLPQKVIIYLTGLINGCLRINYFPEAWKKAIIVTIPKPGKDHNKPDNYRPISLLSSLSKILERVILIKINVAIGPKIRSEQYAFRPQHSTTQQLVKFYDQICTNENNREKTASVFLDIEKAFDRVWREGLLHKLLRIGTPFHLIKIIQSFLQNRLFKIRHDKVLSSSRMSNAGVPQGSCLSPILYNVYTNDIPINNNASLALYADDTLLYTKNRNIHRAISQLQNQINQALVWFCTWRLRINALKTVAVAFSTQTTTNLSRLRINNIDIPWSNNVKYLGVTLDSRLKFVTHVKEIKKKATRIRGMLYPIIGRKSPIPTKTKINIYCMYVRSVLTYAGPAWAPAISKSNWKSLEAVQNIALRTILATPLYVNNKTLLDTSRLPSIQNFILNCTKTLFHTNEISSFRHIRELGRTISDAPSIRRRPINWITDN